ncbi:DinB family protein [Mucilaginibacter limnophilus]|uniref:DinB family protein n=1 Tax=Mucilaginibacter limnophilus TaxID=1932778 RepID=A0A437MTM1_9SPHI|nr:DinB family protein [Mucilaginibacter limnophilus]RVU00993.1 DinB family protein [Mucilaginibacter limnophilus]
MFTETLRTLFSRDLGKLKDELASYHHEANIWRIDGNILNSAGNLSLHLIGNLNTYIGAVLGHTGYVRKRPAEFALKDVPRVELIAQIKETAAVVDKVLGSLTEKTLLDEYPQLVNDAQMTTEFFLVHLAMHLSYHLGQVNYHRRLLDR